jgi:Tol biopolymer transport system component
MRKTLLPPLLMLAAALVGERAARADRKPVLSQIQVPHPYYFREMYLPQLTSGPSGAAWSPDGQELVFSMAGSLWRQRLDSDEAVELTAGPGYDYQPDWSPDGRSVVFARYDRDALELWRLDLSTGQARPLTTGGAVNLEPRISPDGRRLAFVSTRHAGRFHVWVAELGEAGLQEPYAVVEERPTSVARYYYGAFDHEISPSWSPDGSELLFVSNRGNRYGSGGFWRAKVEQGSVPREIRYEETTWKARPDWSPDGRRVVYASYLGRQWHQLWGMTAEGGDGFPLTYGEWDATAPRWSRDGRRVVFVSNRGGNTALWVQEVVGGAQRRIETRRRRYERPMGRVTLQVLGTGRRRVPARISVTGEDGRAYAPEDAWIHADDGFDRSQWPFEAHYFHARSAEVAVPAGRVTVEAMRGFEFRPLRQDVMVPEGGSTLVSFAPSRLALPLAFSSWVSGDLHVHMNYGGAYRNDPARLVAQADAEDLDVVYNLIVNKEQRVPDVAHFSGRPDPASTARVTLMHSQEYHTSYWGHLGLLNLESHLLIPDYAAYDNTFAASLYPTNAAVADLARAQGGLVGYVHPFDPPPPDPFDRSQRLTNALPADVALGKVDYYEVLGFSDHQASAAVWYRLLNLGFRLPAGAGTDAMANFASLRGPVGMNRVYVDSGGARDVKAFGDALRRGRSMATNGPLVGLTLGGRGPGGEVSLPRAGGEIAYSAWLRSIVPVDRFQLVCNGAVAAELPLSGERDTADAKGRVALERSSWCVVRAFADGAAHPVLDAYPYATTSPVYVAVEGTPARSAEDAAYFAAWLDRVLEHAEAHTGYNDAAEREATLSELRRAREVYQARN